MRMLLGFTQLLLLMAALQCHADDSGGGDDEEELPCYTCTATNPDKDDACVNDPDNAGYVPITKCKLGPNQCCVIQRMDDQQEIGTPVSFYRGCQEDCDQDKIGQMVTTKDFTHITYSTYCDEPRCNTGPGNEAPDQPGSNSDYIGYIIGVNKGCKASVVALPTYFACLTATIFFLRLWTSI